MKKSEIEKLLLELRKVYPDLITVTGNWLALARIHRHVQDPFEIRTLRKFNKIMKKLGVDKKD